MGSFVGHVDEATFFVVIGLWWMWNVFPQYILAVWHGDSFQSQTSYAWPGRPKFPIESIFKIGFPIAGFAAELFVDGPYFLDENNRLKGINHLQHMSIYGLFILHGIVDLMEHWGAPLPKGFNRLSMALCFGWYGLGFTFHVNMHGKEGMEKMTHLLPVYAMFLTAVALLVEIVKPSWFLAFAARVYGVCVLGSWFWHTSCMMYLPSPFPGIRDNPKWDHHDVRNANVLVAIFGFHLAVNLVGITIIYLFTAFVMKVRGQHRPQYRLMAPEKDQKLMI